MAQDEVDTVLEKYGALYGSGQPAVAARTTDPMRTAVNKASGQQVEWVGVGGGSYADVAPAVAKKTGDAADTDDHVVTQVSDSATQSATGRKAVDKVRVQYVNGRAVIEPVSNTPPGQAAMLNLKATSVGAGTGVVEQDTATATSRAARVAKLADAILAAESGTGTGTGTGAQTGQTGSATPSINPASLVTPVASAASAIPTAVASAVTPIASAPSSVLSSNPTSPTASSPVAIPAATTGTGTNPTGTVSTAGSGAGSKAVEAAMRHLGLPYVWGGGGLDGPSGGGFDCSGLTRYAIYQATDGRIELPRTTYTQINVGQAIGSLAEAQPGDLIFSNFSSPGVPEHVQLYAGNGQVVEAQTFGVPVKVSSAPSTGIAIRRVL